MSTAKEVAIAANVALPTAYEALRGAGRLAPATRKRVLAAAKALNYRPMAAARTMNTRITGQIGVIGKLHPVAAEVYLGINAALLDRQQVMSLLTFENNTIEAMRERTFRERMFDGTIAVDEIPDSIAANLDAEVNCVWTNTNRYLEHNCIQRDEIAVGRLAAEHLFAAGWRKLVFIYGRHASPHYSQIQRVAGLREVARAANATVRELPCPESGTTWHQLDERLATLEPDEALVFSDTYRLRAMQNVLAKRGWLAGRDIALVCCDDTQEFRLTWPELSRVRFDRPAMGKLAVNMLLEGIETGRPQPSQRLTSAWLPGETIMPAPIKGACR